MHVGMGGLGLFNLKFTTGWLLYGGIFKRFVRNLFYRFPLVLRPLSSDVFNKGQTFFRFCSWMVIFRLGLSVALIVRLDHKFMKALTL